MILDRRLNFAVALALAGGVVTAAVVGDVVDLGVTNAPGATGRDIGDGEDVYVVLRAATPIVVAATGSLRFDVASSAAAAMTAPVIHVSTATYPASTIAAGTTLLAVTLPKGALYLRFLGILQTTVTAGVTSGTLDAFLTHDFAKYRSYADAIAP